MNKKGLRTLVGKIVRLRPSPRRQLAGGATEAIDDDHRVLGVTGEGSLSVRVQNLRTEHEFEIPQDSIRSYRDVGFLELRVQITLDGRIVRREILLAGSGDLQPGGRPKR
jgi:hypothetical protein